MLACLCCQLGFQPAFAEVRDGGVDPANLGKGEWLYYMSSATNQLGGYVSSVTNENSLMLYLKSQGTHYVIVKAATSDQLFNGSYSSPQFTSNLVDAAHANGLLIFGYNRSYGQNIPGEIAIADYVFAQGADGFVWDAEAEWESNQSWIGPNGPALAWQLCSAVRSNWPTKFLAHAPFPIISYHTSFPYKEFGYWSDAVMPQIYHFSAAKAPSAAINWTDVNWAYYQNLWSNLPPTNINGLVVYWTNALKPLVPIQDVYGPPYSAPTPDKDVQEFIDYLGADPNTPALGGYRGANFFRADLHDAQQWEYISGGTPGIAAGVVNNIVLDDPGASVVGAATSVRTFYLTNNTTPKFEGCGSGTDTNSFGTNYVALTQGSGGNYVEFTPNIMVPGDYTLYQWHPYRAEASAGVPFQIAYNGGSTTVYANQQTNDGNWSLLGTFTFAAGTSGKIRVTDAFAEGEGVALADGIKLVFVSPAAVGPAAPSGLTASAVSSSRIDLGWSNNATNAVHNVVARSMVAGGPYMDIAVLPFTSTSFSDTGLAGGTAYYYVVRAVNAAGASANSAQANATTLPAPPEIVMQPQSQIVVVGSNVTFSVVASGAAPLSYQWRHDGVGIGGATQSSYTLASVQASDAGTYSVTVTNDVGSATSWDAVLTVVQGMFTLTVNTDGNGSVTKSPNQASYEAGTMVAVTATPSVGYSFSGWTGDITSTDNPLYVTMLSDLAITANFTPSPTDIVMDNIDAGVTFSGAWATGNTAAGRYGPDYRFSSTIVSGSASTATYRPTITVAGYYSIYVMYPQGGNRAYSTPFAIQTDDAYIELAINQQANGGTWLPLVSQTAHLSPGNDVYVQISNLTGYSGYVVIADAVRFQLYQADPMEPVIVSQPASQIVVVGGTASFGVSATGAEPLSYFWQRDGLPIEGATDSIYTTNNVQLADSGSLFSCLVSNSYGTALSSSAVLTVVTNLPYVFAANFESGLQGFTIDNTYGSGNGLWHLSTGRGLDAGHSATHSLYYGHNEGAAGGGNYSTGTANGGVAVSPIIHLPLVVGSIWLSFNYLMAVESGTSWDVGYVEVSTDNGASYTPVAVKDSYGGLWSATGGSWISNKVDLAAYAGSIIKLRFRFDTIDSVANSTEGWYLDDVIITAPDNAPAVTQQPQDVTTEVGSSVTFSVGASGAAPLSYSWQRNGAPIAEATASSYTTNNVQLGDSGSVFSCLVSNAFGTALSSNAVLTVLAYPPAIVSQPVNQTVNYGGTASFSVIASGTAPLSYFWQRNGIPIVGANDSTYTLSNVQSGDSGSQFGCLVSNAWGAVTSSVATLTVIDPAITSQPVSQEKNVGDSVTFSVTAVGSPPLSYQWWKDGVALAQGTDASLTLVNLQQADAGSYRVVITNLNGSATSAVAVLTVNSVIADDFNPGASGSVYSLAVQPDGKILVGGAFTTLGGQPRSRIGRLNPDGTLDTTFNPGASSYVYSLAVQPDGKILVGGYFTTLGGQPRSRIGRLNPDGTLDTTFNPGASSYVYSLAVQADGKILVGGYFTSLGGQTRSRIGRLNSDGTLDATFNPGASSSVYSLALQADGKILVGGYFTTLAGQPRYYLGRLNSSGSLDTTFNPAANNAVYSLVVQADGKILVGGYFTTLGGQARYYLGRLASNGSLDTTFNPVANSAVYSLALQADGKIVAGGAFTTLGGQTRNWIGRLNDNGSLDTTFNSGANGSVDSLAVQADGKILVGGNFTTLSGQTRYYIGRLNNTEPATQTLTFNGSTITWLRSGTSPEVWRTTFDASTNGGTNWTFLGIGVRVAGGWELTGVSARADANIRARGFATGGEFNGSTWFVESIIGPLLVAGQPVSRTNNAGTVAVFGVQAWGTPPLSYQWLKGGANLSDGGNISGAQASALTLSNVLGGDAGGYSVVISNMFGTATSKVATLTVIDPVITGQPVSQNRELGQSATLNVGAAGTEPLSYQWWKDGGVLAQGTGSSLTFTNLQRADAGSYSVVVSNPYGSLTSAVALLTVNLATADAFNPGANYTVYSLAEQADGKILVGGYFTTLGGQSRYYLGRLNAEGTLDTTFNPGTDGGVYSLAVQPDGKILVGGYFTTLGGQTRYSLGRLNSDGTLDATFNPNAGGSVSNSSAVYSLAVQTDGKILVGGDFTTLGGQPRSRIGRLNPDGTLDTTFNPGASSSVYCLAVQADGKILAGGSFTTLGGQSRYYIGRLNSDGTLDATFNPGANSDVGSLVVQADGKILAGGYFTTLGGQPRNYLGRLNSDGTLDATFNPGANDSVFGLAVQADGKILAGGYFTTLGGQTRAYVGRVNSTEPATQSLTFDGATLTWLRGGTSPEVWRTSLDVSTNGTDWLSLGAGSRIAGLPVEPPSGWQWTNLSLSVGASLRARGFVAGGLFSGSAWFVETDLVTAAPIIVVQPISMTRNVGTDATLNVVADGTPPLSYQWRKDGTTLNGATSTILALANVQESDQGAYSVVVSNSFGYVLSSVAMLMVNQTPVADASATQPIAISANGTDATAVLDATRSSDPDGDLLQCAWFESGTWLANGAVAVVVLPVGAHPLSLVVDDGMLTATNMLTVEVLTSAQAVDRLADAVREDVSRAQPLVATLTAALAAIDRSNPISAINQLLAFQNQVLAQVGPLDPAIAADLIQAAQEVIDALTGGATNPGGRPHGRFTTVAHQPNGRVQLEFSAEQGAVHILEASTNLADWEMIGIAVDHGDGTFEFEDRNAAKFPIRYYRLVTP